MRQPKHPAKVRHPAHPAHGGGTTAGHRPKRGTGKSARGKGKSVPGRAARGTKGAHGGTHGSHHAAHPHHPHTAAKHPAKRGLTPGDVACCTAEALAASLRLTGHLVGAEDVLALYWRTAGTPGAGATVLETLAAAREHGLAGVRPAWFAPVDLGDPLAVILGADLPGPHTVAVCPAGWWSWGQLHDPAVFAGAVIEEAWAVAWAA